MVLSGPNFDKLVIDLRKIIDSGRARAQAAANQALMETYWRCGARIARERLTENSGLMAYYIEAIIKRELRKVDAEFTVGEFFRALNQVHSIPVDVRGTRAWVHNEMKGTATAGYEILGLKLPDRVLKIEKMQNNEESEESVVAQKMAPVLESVAGYFFSKFMCQSRDKDIFPSIFA